MQDPLGLIGTKIEDKYEVESLVGEGGFAVVYRAKHLIFKRPVAIKAFRAMSDFGEEQREKLLQDFIQEGALLAELSERSAAIVQARDIGTLTTARGDWVPYMVLEWLDGASLDHVLEAEKQLAPRTLQRAVKLLEPAVEALAIAHKRGIAHRDVKPANIFILGDPRGEDCTVKLLDFGIAKVVQDAQKMGASFTKTQGAVTSFTPAYGAPEQFSRTHGATGPWTDVYALALVMAEVLTHKAPLQGDDFLQLGFATANPERRPTPRALGAPVSDEIEQVFAKALAVMPDQRYQSAGAFWNALRAALAMEPMPASVASTSDVSTASTLAAPPAVAPTLVAGASSVPEPVATQAPAASSRGAGVRMMAMALGAAIVGGVVVTAVSMHGGDKATKSVVSATASASASSAPMAPAMPACPKDMIHIEGGQFYMGSSDPKADPHEKPSHSVMLTPYCIDRTEVTVEAYKACSDVGKCPPAGHANSFAGLTDGIAKVLDPLCTINEPGGKAKHPINCVDWEMAANYCKQQGGRLPTEAEWEFAARGPDGRAYPWGDDPPGPSFINACGSECIDWAKKNGMLGQVAFAPPMYAANDKFATTAPVGSFPDGKSRYGLLDVVGNVWEWTADFYAEYSKEPQKDPKGPENGEARVARGGAWNGSDLAWVRPTYRFHFAPDSRSYGVGFRCAASPSMR